VSSPSSAKTDDLSVEIDGEVARLKAVLGILDHASSPEKGPSAKTPSVQPAKQEVREVGRKEQLEYNAEIADEEWQDPEQAVGVLPFLGKGWNAKAILENLSQLDKDPLTVTTLGCAAVSILSAHIEQGGPAGVSKVAAQTHKKMKSQIIALTQITKDAESIAAYKSQAKRNAKDDPNDVLKNFIALEAEIGAIPARNSGKKTTYRELRRLAHCMKLVVDWNITGGTNSTEYRELASLGDVLSSYIGKKYKGLAAAVALIDSMKKLDQGPFSLILSVPFGYTVKKKSKKTKVIWHAVNLGIDQDGKVYLFDPYPRKGKQRLMWDSDQEDVKDYFVWPNGKGRKWRIKEVLIANADRGG
jgi:hypothetical protein